jgi:proteic killer suppression protein
MIRSFADDATRKVFERERVAQMGHDLQRMAHRKLLLIEAADELNDLRIPPGNRLEALKGDRAGQHSVRVNDQYRICFRWTASGAEDVQIVDYH